MVFFIDCDSFLHLHNASMKKHLLLSYTKKNKYWYSIQNVNH